ADFFYHFRSDARYLFELLGRHLAELLHRGDTALDKLLNGLVADSHYFADRRAAGHQLLHLRFNFLAFLFLALDVDAPADQFRGQPHILPLLADSERKLIVIDDHFKMFRGTVEQHHAVDLGGTQRIGGKGRGVLIVFDDIDLLSAQLAND